ncbi:MAG: hypothetical protein EOO17_06215 [Chloroflexi bacterium]|nr:MAG: hypothetical protein EOO17_06215 [Chloroflexota bacterium]
MPEPVDVEEIVETITGRDLGGGRSELPVIDIVTNGQGIQTGGRDHAPGVTGNILDTGGNAGAGTGIEVESGAGTGETQTGTVTSR